LGFVCIVKMEFHLFHFDTADHQVTFTAEHTVFSVIFQRTTDQ
jgi:hypothetical protein